MSRNTKSFTVSQLAVELAAKRSIDTTKAAKLVRSKLRNNFASVAAADPNVAKVKTAANDGNRWPALNAKVADFVLNGTKLPAPDTDTE